MEKIIYIPDEYIPDFSLSKEEEKKDGKSGRKNQTKLGKNLRTYESTGN